MRSFLIKFVILSVVSGLTIGHEQDPHPAVRSVARRNHLATGLMSGACLGAFLGGLFGRWFTLQFVFVLFATAWVLALLRRPGAARQTETK